MATPIVYVPTENVPFLYCLAQPWVVVTATCFYIPVVREHFARVVRVYLVSVLKLFFFTE